MTVLTGELEGLLLIQPRVFADDRGWFYETWSERRYHKAGIKERFVQDNFSLSRRGTLRGLHLQNPNAQGKLVMVLQGEVWDVAVDLRRSSPTFCRWQAVRLTGDGKEQFYVPPGFAHGFVVLSDTALFHYKCTAPYSPADEISIRWNDPDLAINWPVSAPMLSPKDAAAPWLRDVPADRLFA
jgi:dTDP-4-dehydrorhamnose 3,5-epimerase